AMNMKMREEGDRGIRAIKFEDDVLRLLDQRLLPEREHWLTIEHLDAAVAAIRDLAVRGAPAIGIAAAYAAVLAARDRKGDFEAWSADLRRLEHARPTAVNLSWAVARMRRSAERSGGLDPDRLLAQARAIHAEDIAANRAMARAGAAVLEARSGVLTHCNTGALATGGIGTALGVIVEAWRQRRVARVYAAETRPWLQGSR